MASKVDVHAPRLVPLRHTHAPLPPTMRPPLCGMLQDALGALRAFRKAAHLEAGHAHAVLPPPMLPQLLRGRKRCRNTSQSVQYQSQVRNGHGRCGPSRQGRTFSPTKESSQRISSHAWCAALHAITALFSQKHGHGLSEQHWLRRRCRRRLHLRCSMSASAFSKWLKAPNERWHTCRTRTCARSEVCRYLTATSGIHPECEFQKVQHA